MLRLGGAAPRRTLRINLLFVALNAEEHGVEGGIFAECTINAQCKRLLFLGKAISPLVLEFPERSGMFEFRSISESGEHASTFKLGFSRAQDEEAIGFAVLSGNHGVETCEIKGAGARSIGHCCVSVIWETEAEEAARQSRQEEAEEESMELEICLQSKPNSGSLPPPRLSAVKEQYWLSFRFCEMLVCSESFTDLRHPSFPATVDTFKIIATRENARLYAKHTPLVIKVNSSLRGVVAIAVIPASFCQRALLPPPHGEFYSWIASEEDIVGDFEVEYRVYQTATAETEALAAAEASMDHDELEEYDEFSLRSDSPPPPPPPPPPFPSTSTRTLPMRHHRRSTSSGDAGQSLQEDFIQLTELRLRLEMQEKEGLAKLESIKNTQEQLNEMEREVAKTLGLLEKREKQLALREAEFRRQSARDRKFISDAKLKLEAEREEFAKERKLQEGVLAKRLQVQLRNLSEEKRAVQRELDQARASLKSLEARLVEEMEVSKTKDERIAKLRLELKRAGMLNGGGGAGGGGSNILQPNNMSNTAEPHKRRVNGEQQREGFFQRPLTTTTPQEATNRNTSFFNSPSQMTAAERLQFLVQAKAQLQRTNPDLPELWRQFDVQIEAAKRAITAAPPPVSSW